MNGSDSGIVRTGIERLSGMFIGIVTEILELFNTAIGQTEYMDSRGPDRRAVAATEISAKKIFIFRVRRQVLNWTMLSAL